MVYLEVAVVTMIGLVSEKSRRSVPVVAAELGLKYLPICTCAYMQGTERVNVD